MPPLILITNDDGFSAKGLRFLDTVAQDYGDVIVMAPERNSSGLSHSFTSNRPLRVRDIKKGEHLEVYACDGTPVDCVKLALEHFCPRRPSLILSGINHGSNASVNILYSGTMGAVIEATTMGFPSVGFSLLNPYIDADFSNCEATVRHIIGNVLQKGLPENVSLNVNIPDIAQEQQKGIRICHASHGLWTDSYEKRIDPHGQPYWWLTGTFHSDDSNPDSDEWALKNGYVSVVPIHPDYTCDSAIDAIREQLAAD